MSELTAKRLLEEARSGQKTVSLEAAERMAKFSDAANAFINAAKLRPKPSEALDFLDSARQSLIEGVHFAEEKGPKEGALQFKKRVVEISINMAELLKPLHRNSNHVGEIEPLSLDRFAKELAHSGNIAIDIGDNRAALELFTAAAKTHLERILSDEKITLNSKVSDFEKMIDSLSKKLLEKLKT